MTTINDIVTSTLRSLQIDGAGEDPEAVVAAEALTALNHMMLALPTEGVHTGWTELALTDTFPLEDRHIQGVKWMLAENIGPNHGVVLSREQQKQATAGRLALVADYKVLDLLTVDNALSNLPSQRLWW